MPAHLVFQVQVVVFGRIGQVGDPDFQLMVTLECALLAAARDKPSDIDAKWNAGTTTIAIWPISEQTASAKSFGNQFGISVVVYQVAWGGHLRAGLSVVQITARVGRSGIKLQGLKR